MTEEILIFSKCLQLFIFIILIFNQVTNSSGLDDLNGKFCPSLTSTTSTSFKCKYNGTHVENCENPRNGTTVLISCIGFNEESSLQENPIRLCRNGEWSSDIPRCYPMSILGEDILVARFKPKPNVDQNNSHGSCPSLTSNLSTNVTCVYKNTILRSCQNPPNGTIVIITCNPFYTRESFEENSNIICRNGRWSTAIPECHPSHSESNLLIGPHNDLHRIYCPPLTPSASTNFECKHNAKPRDDCLNSVHNTTVLISCNPFYEEASLEINPIRLCQNGKWSSTIPQCYPINYEGSFPSYDPSISDQTTYPRICQSLTSTTTTNVKCEHNDRLLQNCKNPIDGTTVLISCKPLYEEGSLRSNPIRTCKDGKWSSSIPQCFPIYSTALSTASENSKPSIDVPPRYQKNNNCQSLTATKSTNYKCEHNGKPLVNCQNPIDGTTVLISCNPFYEESTLNNNPTRICRNGNWSSSIPQCYSTPSVCPSLISTTSTNFQCIHKRKPLNNCENAINGTLMIISCNTFYEEPSLQNNPIRICRNGKWSSTIPQCYPICGKVPAKVFRAVDRKNALHDHPWHVGIYNTAKKYLCGGTIIIKPKIILTAAHCVTDDNEEIIHPSNYLVAAGKYYLNFTDPRDEYAQYAEVSEIHIPTGYKWSRTALPFDMAVLVLKEPFTVSIAVQPVCLKLNGKTENLINLVNNTGIVTGWGSIQKGGPRSEVLKELQIPYVPFSQCYQEVQEPWRDFLTNDKICGGNIQNGGIICHGDGGGGFIFKNVIEDRYYIEAVVSLGVFNKFNECYSNQLTAYTSVLYTTQFLKTVIATL